MTNTIERVVVLGHLGFIGGHIFEQLSKNPNVSVIGVSYPEVDLTKEEDAGRLKDLFDMNTAVVMCSGIKPSIANSYDSFNKNIAMVLNVCRVLDSYPVKRFIFFSSAAVYGEDIHNLSINEHSQIDARSYYGMSKYISECLLRKSMSVYKKSTFLSLRPPAIYGPNDADFSYTPSGFLKKIKNNIQFELWGDGEELREFIYVGDIVRLVDHFLFNHEYNGVLNIASGKNYSFIESIRLISEILKLDAHFTKRERTKDKVDNAFDNSLLLSLCQEFKFNSLEDGLRLTFDSMR